MSITQNYRIDGMSCEHCARSVSSELGALDGVSDVQVDVAAGRATVTSAAPLERGRVAAAVTEAGYSLQEAGGE